MKNVKKNRTGQRRLISFFLGNGTSFEQQLGRESQAQRRARTADAALSRGTWQGSTATGGRATKTPAFVARKDPWRKYCINPFFLIWGVSLSVKNPFYTFWFKFLVSVWTWFLLPPIFFSERDATRAPVCHVCENAMKCNELSWSLKRKLLEIERHKIGASIYSLRICLVKLASV